MDYFLDEPLSLIAILTFIFYLYTFLEFYFGFKSIRNLSSLPAKPGNEPPFVSIIIPARNEEVKIKEALSSVLNLDYPAYEVIVLNDRSEDRTGEILDEMAASNPKLKVVHIKSLPGGWLGKNYVLDYGAKQAQGEYLLFSDADVIYEPDTLLRIMPYVKEKSVDHMSMAPSHIYREFLLTAVVLVFEFMFMMRYKPWRVSNPRSRYFLGIGSFNMIKAEVYKKTGGFETLKMRPDDDIMLGKLVKKHRYRSDFMFATGHLKIEWYSTLGEMVRAFYKNTYSGFNYNFIFFLSSIILLITFCLFPYVNIFLTDIIGLIFNIGVLLIIFFIYLLLSRNDGISILYYFTYPAACCVIIYTMMRAVMLTLVKGGIDWRGTFYSFKELKRNKI